MTVSPDIAGFAFVCGFCGGVGWHMGPARRPLGRDGVEQMRLLAAIQVGMIVGKVFDLPWLIVLAPTLGAVAVVVLVLAVFGLAEVCLRIGR